MNANELLRQAKLYEQLAKKLNEAGKILSAVEKMHTLQTIAKKTTKKPKIQTTKKNQQKNDANDFVNALNSIANEIKESNEQVKNILNE